MTRPGAAPHSISVCAKTYGRLEREAERRGIAVSSLVEALVAPVLGTKPPAPRRFRRRTRKVQP